MLRTKCIISSFSESFESSFVAQKLIQKCLQQCVQAKDDKQNTIETLSPYECRM